MTFLIGFLSVCLFVCLLAAIFVPWVNRSKQPPLALQPKFRFDPKKLFFELKVIR